MQRLSAISVERHDCDIIQDAVRRYYRLVFLNANSNEDLTAPSGYANTQFPRNDEHFGGYLDTLRVHLMAPCKQYPSEYMDERYEIFINSDGYERSGLLVAQSVWGILRGLETFSQLVHSVNGYKFAIRSLSLLDFPAFSHRGLLIDTSRHFLPVKTITRILDAMTYSKLNVLHWHMTDDQSFPFESTTYPALGDRGAYNKYFAIYTHSDIEQIIEYARKRGIRVIPEFDTPGHTLSWGLGMPGLLTKCGDPHLGEYGPIDPTRESNYIFLENLFKEIAELFPDNYFHLGGDEVNFDCWNSSPEIRSFMRYHNITSFQELESYYIQRVLAITRNLNTKPVVWQEVFDNGVRLTDDAVVHVWQLESYEAEMDLVTKSGHRALLSACWYLDHLDRGWQKFYECNPLDYVHSIAQRRYIMGGEACMWGESVDESNIEQRIWPRACATAEILWTGYASSDAANRLEEHTCRLKKRGIPAQPPNGPGFCPYFIKI
ncbi:hypothetical protein V9T40_004039 [Parthenolecanium corni]|uniref:Beta-hexosaminidase n=1 Tax=Parthenolecanium corni TaxID=536013 RepID=A0AAN9TVC0_9HEMI